MAVVGTVTVRGKPYPIYDSPPTSQTWLQNGMFGLNMKYVNLIQILNAQGRTRNKPRTADQVNGYVVHVTAGYSTLSGFLNYIANQWAAGETPTMPSGVNTYEEGYFQLLPLEQIGAATADMEPYIYACETVNKGDANQDTWTLQQKLDHARVYAQGVARGWWRLGVIQVTTPDFARGGLGFHTMQGDSSRQKCTNGTSDMTLVCGKSCPGYFHRGYTQNRGRYPWKSDGSDLLGTMALIYSTARGYLAGPAPNPELEEDMPRLVKGDAPEPNIPVDNDWPFLNNVNAVWEARDGKIYRVANGWYGQLNDVVSRPGYQKAINEMIRGGNAQQTYPSGGGSGTPVECKFSGFDFSGKAVPSNG